MDPLRKLHRMLAVRLLAVAGVVSLIVAAFVVREERARSLAVASDRAIVGAATVQAVLRERLDTRDLGDRDGIERALRAFTVQGADLAAGRFALLRILRPDGQEVARVADPAYPGADALSAASAREGALASGVPERTSVARVDFGSGSALRAIAPLRDGRGAVAAVAEGFFVPTAAAEAAARARLRRALALAAGTVLLTTALLYPILRGLLGRLGALSVQLLDSNLEMLQVVGSAIAKRDSDTDAHNYRVTIYAARIGEALGLDDAAMRGLVKGAMLHDVGKIGIRDDILLKPGRLDEREFAVMQAHVRHGLDIVNRASWLRDAAPIVGAHHEKYDGTGYFEKLAGVEIPLAARIFAVADVFDAVTSRRPYHEPLGFEGAMALLEAGRGRHFDPAILDVFAEIAEPLHATYADRDDERLRSDHAAIVERYYRTDLTAFLPRGS